MATSFPSSLDSFTNPSASDALDSVSVPHADQHANINDAVEALQAKVGVDGSAVTSSLDYKVNALPGGLVAYADRSTDYSGISTSEVTVLTATADIVSGRNYLIEATTFWYSPSTTMRIESRLYQGATRIQEHNTIGSTTISHGILPISRSFTASSTGSATFTFRCFSTTGTFNLAGNAQYPMQLRVYDIGDAV